MIQKIPNIDDSQEKYRELIEILGNEYAETTIESPFDFINISKKGIRAELISNFKSRFNISKELTAGLLNISEPTLYRWIKENKILDEYLVIKILKISELFIFGIKILENKENFFKWIDLPNISLGGYKPKQLIAYPGGISKVRDVLGRIEHGVYS